MRYTSPLVEGKIIFDRLAKSFSHSTVYIYLEDVSMADAPSRVISEQVIADVDLVATQDPAIEFVLYGKIHDYNASYAIRVHADIDRDGKLSKGDFINMESYHVLTHGYPKNILIHVRQIM